MAVQRVISGGQTGVDQGALDAALAAGIPHGGWCPRGRRCESGRIPQRFRLKESPSPEYRVRTEQNVVDSDGSLILYDGHLHGGTALTLRFAQKHDRPFLLVDLAESPTAVEVRDWLDGHAIEILNVAGPRESSHPGIYERTLGFLKTVFRP